MKLYHATPLCNREDVLKNGLIATNGIIGNPDGIPKYVYFAANMKEAAAYGDVMFEIETDDFTEEFGVYEEFIGTVYNHLGDIPPEKLKEIDMNSAKIIIEQETWTNPLCKFERVLSLPDDGICMFELLLRDDEIVLNNIRVAPEHCNKGYGTAGLTWLKTVAERSMTPITGQIAPSGHQTLDIKTLKQWYTKNGFTVKNGGIAYYPESIY